MLLRFGGGSRDMAAVPWRAMEGGVGGRPLLSTPVEMPGDASGVDCWLFAGDSVSWSDCASRDGSWRGAAAGRYWR